MLSILDQRPLMHLYVVTGDERGGFFDINAQYCYYINGCWNRMGRQARQCEGVTWNACVAGGGLTGRILWNRSGTRSGGTWDAWVTSLFFFFWGIAGVKCLGLCLVTNLEHQRDKRKPWVGSQLLTSSTKVAVHSHVGRPLPKQASLHCRFRELACLENPGAHFLHFGLGGIASDGRIHVENPSGFHPWSLLETAYTD